MFKPILVWFGFLAVVRYQTLFLEEAKDISKFLSGTLQSKGPLKIWLMGPLEKVPKHPMHIVPYCFQRNGELTTHFLFL